MIVNIVVTHKHSQNDGTKDGAWICVIKRDLWLIVVAM